MHGHSFHMGVLHEKPKLCKFLKDGLLSAKTRKEYIICILVCKTYFKLVNA